MGLIYLDSCLLIYLVERHPLWSGPVTDALTTAVDQRFCISPLIKSECLVGPFKRLDPVLQQAYEDFFERFVTLPISESVFLQAARIRAHFGLKTPDALHLACAQHHRCEALWTNDERLTKAGHGLARNILT